MKQYVDNCYELKLGFYFQLFHSSYTIIIDNIHCFYTKYLKDELINKGIRVTWDGSDP